MKGNTLFVLSDSKNRLLLLAYYLLGMKDKIFGGIFGFLLKSMFKNYPLGYKNALS